MYDNFGGPGFDWNGNGGKDAFDHYMDMKATGSQPETMGLSGRSAGPAGGGIRPSNLQKKTSGGIILYDSTKDSDGVALLKALAVCGLCLVGMAVLVTSGMGDLGTLVWLGSCIGLSFRILKNR